MTKDFYEKLADQTSEEGVTESLFSYMHNYERALLAKRRSGMTYEDIGKELGFSTARARFLIEYKARPKLWCKILQNCGINPDYHPNSLFDAIEILSLGRYSSISLEEQVLAIGIDKGYIKFPSSVEDFQKMHLDYKDSIKNKMSERQRLRAEKMALQSRDNKIKMIKQLTLRLEDRVDKLDSNFPEIKAKDSPYYHKALSSLKNYSEFLITRAKFIPSVIKSGDNMAVAKTGGNKDV